MMTPFSVLNAQSPNSPRNYDGAIGGPKIIEEGQPPVIIHPTVDDARRAREAQHSVQGASATSNLIYNGGSVETAPLVFVVFWGSQWNSNDPSHEASILNGFYSGVGGTSWLATVTQYCEGASTGSISCGGNGEIAAGNPDPIYITTGGYWYDNASAAPSHPSQSQLAAEAVRAAAHFAAVVPSGATPQYVIATAHGYNSRGFKTQYCAWHSSTSSSYGNIAYTNLPYITDAGASCGANFNNLGETAGITIVGGHEMAESITDPFPSSGWTDSSGSEIGDKCAWISSGTGAAADITLKTAGYPTNNYSYPVQSLWSNASNSGAGGCVVSY